MKKMRVRYPSTHIHCAYYGRSGSELKTRFEDGDLPGITELVGEKGVFRDKAGNPGPVLDDFNAMITASILYDVDLTQKELGLGYKANLGPMLKTVLRFEVQASRTRSGTICGNGTECLTRPKPGIHPGAIRCRTDRQKGASTPSCGDINSSLRWLRRQLQSRKKAGLTTKR